MGAKIAHNILSLLVNILKTIRNIIFISCVALGHIPLSIFIIWKRIVDFVVVKLDKDYSPMSVLDYLCVNGMDSTIQEPNAKDLHANLGITCVIEGKVDTNQFFDNFVTRVVNTDINSPSDINSKHPHIRFYQNVRKFGGYWYFKTVTNNLKCEDHVTCLTLKIDSVTTTHEEVCKWLAERYNKDVPLWGILLLFRENTQDTFVVIKVHHVLADGYSMLHILDLVTDTKYKYQVKDFNDTRWEKLKMLTESVYKTVAHNSKFFSVPKSPLVEREEEEIFLSFASIPVSSVKEIRVQAGVRFQSVMLSLVRSYVQKILLEICDEKDIPDKIIITNSLPWPKHPRNVLCNHQTGAAFVFPDLKNVTKSKQEVLSYTDSMFETYHTQNLNKASHFLSGSFGSVPRIILSAKWLQNSALDKLSAGYVHLIGSEEYSQVFGARCSDVHLFTIPPRQKGLTVTCLTTSKEVRISIMGPKWIFPSQEKADQFSHDCFLRAVSELTTSVAENKIYS